MDVLLHLSLSSVILTHSSTESPVHVLMLSIQAVRGLPVSSVEMTVSPLLLMQSSLCAAGKVVCVA